MIVSVIRIVLVILYSAFCASLVIICAPFDRTHRAYWKIAHMYGLGAIALAGSRLSVQGLERLRSDRSYVYVSNHASLFDIPAVLAGIPYDVRIIYKKELHWVPIFGWGLKIGRRDIAIDRGKGQDAMRSIEAAVEKIRGGASVILFGEGTRTRDGKLQQFKRGPFNLAMKAGVPVVPVTINGSYSILKKGSVRLQRGTITLVISDPIEIPEQNGKDAEFILREQVRRAIESNYKDQ